MDGTHICFCSFPDKILENSPLVCDVLCCKMNDDALDGTVGKLSATLRACVTPWNN